MRTLLLVHALWLAFCFGSTLLGQETSKNWRHERAAIEKPYHDEIQELIKNLKSRGDVATAEAMQKQLLARDPQRQYIFIAGDESAPTPTNGDQVKLREIKNRHAERVFELAKRAAADDSGALAYQFLHEVLYLNPDHKEVREALSHRQTETGWRVAPERLKVKKATRPHSITKWKEKEYLRVTTSHFIIDSIADEETTIALAQKLERWHGIWRQVFLEFWTSEKSVKRWIEKGGPSRRSSRRYKIVFFDSAESYAEQLEPMIKGISESSGYYSDQLKTSFFYAGEETTWRHELTHQLFQETKTGTIGPFQDGFLWLGEGIAMYFESLIDHGDFVTLGGFDAQRLQYSRIRLFRERYYLPLSQISGMSQTDFQTNQFRRRLYSQSAGMCHLLMNGNDGIYQDRLIEFLKLIYAGKLRAGTFEKVMKLTDDVFKTEYREFLRVENETIEQHLLSPLTRVELSLANENLSAAAMEQIGRCTNLELLDLSENAIEAEDMKSLSDCDSLEELFLSNCDIADGALQHLSELANLRIVDLTVSRLSDSEFLSLAGCQKLKSVTIRGTNISASAISELKRKIPGIDIQK